MILRPYMLAGAFAALAFGAMAAPAVKPVLASDIPVAHTPPGPNGWGRTFPAPVLATRRAQVTRLVQQWSAPLADSLAAMNLFRDESAVRRAAQVAAVRDAAGGQCVNEGSFVVENALRGRWRMRCAREDLVVAITLAPTMPAGVQYLDVSPLARDASLAVASTCRR